MDWRVPQKVELKLTDLSGLKADSKPINCGFVAASYIFIDIAPIFVVYYFAFS